MHRDISTGNILIFRDSNGESFGRLMDYDHAKTTKEFTPLTPKAKDLSDDDFEEFKKTVQSLIKFDKLSTVVEDDVVREALKWVDFSWIAAPYVMKSVGVFLSTSGSQKSRISMSDLRWDNEPIKQWPNFLNRTHREGERTGTLPFMSGEVIARTSLVFHGAEPRFVHQAIHDLESFLWVLVRICMSRKGPGIGMGREKELDINKPGFYNPALSHALVSYFDGTEDVLKESKAKLLRSTERFENDIVKNFDPYFEPFKPLVRQWWNIIILGYMYRAHEFYNIHHHILRIIDDALPTLPDESKAEATRKELTRREKHRARLLGTFKSTAPAGNTSISTPPGSPRTSLIITPPLSYQVLHSEQDSPSARKQRPSKRQKM
ncbi:hypothetical protein C0995_011338 [Termitomyces sp. Mi166|nr:hypothetical protein C0995_012304 [Termitomyces sp. Mi166\